MQIDDEMRRDLIDVLGSFIKIAERCTEQGERRLIKAKDIKWSLENEKGINKKDFS